MLNRLKKLIRPIVIAVILFALVLPIIPARVVSADVSPIYTVENTGLYDSIKATSYFYNRNQVRALDGTIWVCYQKDTALGEGSWQQVWCARSTDDGQTWTTEQVTYTATDKFQPDIAVDSSGNLHCVWFAFAESSYPSSVNVYYNMRTSGGWGTAYQVCNKVYGVDYNAIYVDDGNRMASIGVDSADNIHLIWAGHGWGTNYDYFQIMYRQKTSGGTWLDPVQLTDVNRRQYYPSFTIDSADNLHVSWYGGGWGTNVGYYQVLYKKCTSGVWASTVQITDDTYNPYTMPDTVGTNTPRSTMICVDSSNKPHLVMRSLGYGYANANIYYTNNVSGTWAVMTALTTSTATQAYPSIAADASDNIWVAWYTDAGQIYVKQKTVAGVWQTQSQLTTTSVTHRHPDLMFSTWPKSSGVSSSIMTSGYTVLWTEGQYYTASITRTSPPCYIKYYKNGAYSSGSGSAVPVTTTFYPTTNDSCGYTYAKGSLYSYVHDLNPGWGGGSSEAIAYVGQISTTTATGSTSPFSSASDGRVYNTANASWATARATTTATVQNTTATVTIAGAFKSGTTWYISRGFMYFDTSAIPDGAGIINASVYLNPSANASGDAQSLYVVTPISSTYPHDPMVGTDFDVTKYSGIIGSIASTSWINTSAYVGIGLNEAGKSYISKTGTTKFAFMCSKDYLNTEPSATSEFEVNCQEQTATSKDPYMVVWYGDSNEIYRAQFSFDTSAIPDGSTVTAATLDLYGGTKPGSFSDFDITAVDGTGVSSPAVAADYYTLLGMTTSWGALTTTAFSTSGYNTITLNAVGLAGVDVTGTTEIGIRSSADIASTYSAGYNQYVSVKTSVAGTSYRPKLTVTYVSGDPTVTTSAATSVASSSAIFNGNLTGLGLSSTVYVGFEYGLTTGYGTSTAEQVRTTIGTFNQPRTGLTSGVTYHYKAFARPSGGTTKYYGSDQYFTTTTVASPTVTTSTAIDIATSSATLQGIVTSLGGYSTVYASFDYGPDTSYGYSTVQQTKTNSSSYSSPISGLTPGQTYHFRAKVQYDTSSYIYGEDLAFLTSTVMPGVPTSFTAKGTGTSIVLNWVKGSDSVNTLVRYSETSTPTSTAEGTQAYFSSASTYTLPGLTPGTTYYFSAWGENNGVYSVSKVSTSSQPTVGALADPDILSIEDVKVYKDYSQVGSQLYVISYKIIYTAGNPAQDPADYFNLDLWDGALLLARTKVANWGFYPASIYLYTSNMPTWGLDYTVKITGIDSKWTTPPETTYALTSGDWIGTDLTNLDYWVIRHAQSLENYYTTDLTTYTTGSGTRLNDAGGEIYREAIPGLSVARPDLFSIGVFSVNPDSLDPDGLSQEGQTDLTDNFGATVMAKFTDLGSYMGLSGTAVAGMFWFVILIIVVGIASMATGAPIVGLLIGIPILFIGNYLGCIPLAIMAILSIIAIILTLMQLWLARS